MVSLGPPTGWTPSPPAATPGDPADPASHPAAPAPAAAAPAPASEWRSEGSVLLGLDLVRSVFDASGSPTAQVKAKVIGWLPAAVSDYVDGAGRPAALYRICYLDGTVRGDVEDLVEDEVRGSVPFESRAALAEREQIMLEENGGAPPPKVMLPVSEEDDDEEEEEEEEDDDEDAALARRLAEEDEEYDEEDEAPPPPVEDDADEWLPGADRPKKRRAPKAKKAKKAAPKTGSVTKPAGGGEKKKKPPRPRATGGRWTDSDSIKLKVAYDKSPSNWTLIAAQFDNRTPGACRDRYRTMYGEAKPEKHNGAPVGLAAPQGAIPKPRGRAPKLPDGSPAAWDPVKGEWIGVTTKAKPRASRAPKAAAPKRKAPPPAPYRSPEPAAPDVVALTTAERAAILHAIAQLDGQATQKKVRRAAESVLGAPEGALDEKKQAVKELCREEVMRLEALRPPAKKLKVASSTDSEPVPETLLDTEPPVAEPAAAPAVGSPPSMVSLLPASAGAP